MVLAHDALYLSLQSGVRRKRYRMGEQKVCQPQPLWKVYILEYDCPFDIRAGLLSCILPNEMVGDGIYILYFTSFKSSSYIILIVFYRSSSR